MLIDPGGVLLRDLPLHLAPRGLQHSPVGEKRASHRKEKDVSGAGVRR
jgi:hypothetical protein